MKKTVNINLAGTFFHIDEDAFGKLQRYLDAIKRSLSDPQGSDEIIRDIEARIAELFSEKLETQSQVISIKELDEVITVMGQPEDYIVDEEIFDDVPLSKKVDHSSYKQLYRDIDNKFVAGVSSGLGHYLKIDAIWVRLLWILLTIATSGLFILIYIMFWILVPAAITTTDKLKMGGEAVNISNIERKFKEGYENVADRVKNADYDKYGQRVKTGTTSFFDTVGKIIMTLLTIFVKLIGVFLVFISLTTLIALIVSLFTVGTVGIWGDNEVMDYITIADATSTPVWVISLLALLAIGIPFFALFILGLKMIVNNLKSIGTTAKIALLVIWFASLIGIGVVAVQQATERAYDGDIISETMIPIKAGETIRMAMRADNQYEYEVSRQGGPQLKYDQNDNQFIYSNDIRLIVRSTKDSVGKLLVERKAQGSSSLQAKERAEDIIYNYSYKNNILLLDGFFITDTENKFRDQEVELVLYLPIGTILIADENTYSFHRNDSRYHDILDNGDEGQQLLIQDGLTKCLDCPVSNETEDNDWPNDDKDTDDSPSENWEQDVNNSFSDDEAPIKTPETPEVTTPSEVLENTTIQTDSINN